MVGELDVVIAGQKATIQFVDDHILLCISDYKTAWEFMKTPVPNLALPGKLLSFSKIKLLAQVGKSKPIELFPQPSWFVRLMSPAVRGMVKPSDS